jgi:hypothetical protein
MIGIVTAMMLSMVMAKPDPVDMARKNFNNCLIELHNKGVDGKISLSAFRESMAENCIAEKTGYRDLIVKAERGYGSKQAEAEKFADEEVQAIVDSIASSFAENAERNAKLTLEK